MRGTDQEAVLRAVNDAVNDALGNADSKSTFLSNDELAERYGVPIATVRKWRHEGTGPRGLRAGRHVRYRLSDVEAWEEDRADPAA